MPATHYQVLRVSNDVTPRDLKLAYHRALREHHPDIAGPGHEEMAARITAAYAILSDPQQRAEYDRTLERPAEHQSQQARPTGPVREPSPTRPKREQSSNKWFGQMPTPRYTTETGIVITAHPLRETALKAAGTYLGCTLATIILAALITSTPTIAALTVFVLAAAAGVFVSVWGVPNRETRRAGSYHWLPSRTTMWATTAVLTAVSIVAVVTPYMLTPARIYVAAAIGGALCWAPAGALLSYWQVCRQRDSMFTTSTMRDSFTFGATAPRSIADVWSREAVHAFADLPGLRAFFNPVPGGHIPLVLINGHRVALLGVTMAPGGQYQSTATRIIGQLPTQIVELPIEEWVTECAFMRDALSRNEIDTVAVHLLISNDGNSFKIANDDPYLADVFTLSVLHHWLQGDGSDTVDQAVLCHVTEAAVAAAP